MKPVNGGPVKLSTSVDFELADGTHVPLTFTWSCMMQIEARAKDVYKRFSRAFMAGELMDSIITAATSVYVAYLCGYIVNNGSMQGCMSEREFLDAMPQDFGRAAKVIGEVFFPKGTEDSENLS